MADCSTAKRGRVDAASNEAEKAKKTCKQEDDVEAAAKKSDVPRKSLIPEQMKRELIQFASRRMQLIGIHAQIVEEEAGFAQRKKEWEEENQPLHLDDIDQFFLQRYENLEKRFEEDTLKPLYDERSHVAMKLFGGKHPPGRFWYFALVSNKLLSKQISEDDQNVLDFLLDIRSKRTDNLMGFELIFTFADPNPYFTNKVLTKTFELTSDHNDFVLLKENGTKIDWKSPHENRDGNKSFFKFFRSYEPLGPFWFDKEADELRGEIPTDYVTGTIIRDKIIPHAISWSFFIETNDGDSDGSDEEGDFDSD